MTQIQIVNLSLNILGQNTITSAQLTADAHPSAVAANIWWTPCRDEVLGSSNWSFATVTESLVAYDIDDSEWDFVYQYPTLTVSSIWRIWNDGSIGNSDKQEFTVKHIPTLGVSAVYTDLEDAYVEYTYQVTDTSLWSTQFVMAFAYRLAAAMAISLTGAKDKGIEAAATYNGLISEAKRLGFSEKKKRPDSQSAYIDAR